jgi:hypothetical protein
VNCLLVESKVHVPTAVAPEVAVAAGDNCHLDIVQTDRYKSARHIPLLHYIEKKKNFGAKQMRQAHRIFMKMCFVQLVYL